MSHGYTRAVPVDTDVTLAANSDFFVPSQKAVKTYVDNVVPPTPAAASETVSGIAELANNAEALAGTDDLRIMTSLKVAAALSARVGTSTEGTFTPAFTFETLGNLSVVYTVQQGFYKRVGNLVFVHGRVAFTPTHTTASGFANIVGFPFSASTSVAQVGVNTFINNSLTWPTGHTEVMLNPLAGLTTMRFLSQGTAVASNGWGLTQFPTATARDVYFSGCYAVEPAASGASAPVRERLQSARTYYVRTDGSDSNTGLADTAGGAFLTVQKAIDVAATLDFAGYTVTLQVRSGTFAGITLKPVLGGPLIVQGDTTTPANVILSSSTTHAIQAMSVQGCDITVQGFEVTTTGSGVNGIQCSASTIKFGVMRFAACVFAHISAEDASFVSMTANYSIVGASTRHFSMQENAILRLANGLTVTITGTPAFSSAFCFSGTGAVTRFRTTTFSGGATGTRWSATGNGVIDIGGGTPNTYIPGNVNGAAATGGQTV